jgi:hypothetical protein
MTEFVAVIGRVEGEFQRPTPTRMIAMQRNSKPED